MRTQSRAYLLISAFVLAAALSGIAFARPGRPQESNKPGASSGAPLVADKGTLRIELNGQMVGSEEFEIAPASGSWTARGSTTVHVPGGGDMKSTSQFKFAPDGTPIHYEWTAPTQKKSGVVEFSNGTAKTTVDVGGTAPYLQNFTFPSPRVAILDNNLYHQYELLAHLYDWGKADKQSFPVLIPQDSTPGSISVESLGEQEAGGAKYNELRVTSTDLQILLYLDGAHRLMRLEVPASKVVISRQ